MLVFKEVTSRHSGAYTCVASNAAASANYTAHLMVKGICQIENQNYQFNMLMLAEQP